MHPDLGRARDPGLTAARDRKRIQIRCGRNGGVMRVTGLGPAGGAAHRVRQAYGTARDGPLRRVAAPGRGRPYVPRRDIRRAGRPEMIAYASVGMGIPTEGTPPVVMGARRH